MLELDYSTSSSGQSVNIQNNTRVTENVKKPSSNRTKSVGQHHGHKARRDTNERRSSSQRIRDTHHVDQSHQTQQRDTSSTKALNAVTADWTVETPSCSSKKPGQDENNGTDNIQQTCTKKWSEKESKKSRRCHAEHDEASEIGQSFRRKITTTQELDGPPPSPSDHIVNIHKTRTTETVKKPSSSRTLKHSMPGHETKSKSVGHRARRDTNERTSTSQRSRDMRHVNQSHQPKQHETRSTKPFNEVPTGSTVETPNRSPKKSCHDNDNTYNIQQTCTNKRSEKETKTSRRSNARCGDRIKASHEQRTSPSTRSNLVNSKNSTMLAVSTSGSSGGDSSMKKSCHESDNTNIIQQSCTNKRSEKDTKTSRRSHARCVDSTQAAQEQPTCTSTRSNVHNSQDFKMLAMSTSGSSGGDGSTKKLFQENDNTKNIKQTCTNKRSEKETKTSRSSHARCIQGSHEQPTSTSTSTSTNSNLHNLLAVSTSGSSGCDSVARKINSNTDETTITLGEVSTVPAPTSSSRKTRQHKTKQSGALDNTKNQRSQGKIMSSTINRDQELAKEHSPKADDEDDKENSRNAPVVAGAFENFACRKDHQEDVALQQSSSVASRNINDCTQCTGSLKESDAAVPGKVPLESKREQRQSASPQDKGNKSKGKTQDSSVEAVSSEQSLEPVHDMPSSPGQGLHSTASRRTPKSPCSQRHRGHRKQTARGEQKTSATTLTNATTALEGNINQRDRVPSKKSRIDLSQNQKQTEASSPTPVESFDHDKAPKIDEPNDNDRSFKSAFDCIAHHQSGEQATVAIESLNNTNLGTEHTTAGVRNCEVDTLLVQHSGDKQGTAKETGLSVCCHEPNKLKRRLEPNEPSKVVRNSHERPRASRKAHVASEQPLQTRTTQHDDIGLDHQIDAALTSPESGKGSLDVPSAIQGNCKFRSGGAWQRILSIPRTMRRWNQQQKSRRLLLQASKSLSSRSTTLLSLRQFEDDFLANDDPSRPSLLEKAKSESILGGADPWFYNATAIPNDSMASMEMVFFFTENEDEEKRIE